ncbi:molybdopterin-dependent oxidoreductase [Arcicella sp. DC2W]|uniref:Molybdopterin-dependent oxidoreductase n=1 Tax=Arcicella gelida TaxID=2984195 RepID=A0ABU5S9C5_9BACT|nr:molybdopterin-dependent oxidoreductase [Arcicella sp. DC2W]MEA5405074.1 molybdopterin-dependent oxidoreductase [Arcicella sp. DC2W]
MSSKSNLKKYKSTCSYCGVGCGVEVTDLGNGRLHLEGDKDHPSSKGMLCSKGMNLHYTVMDQSDRLLYPEMRFNRNMPLQRVSWDTALDRTAAIFKTFIQKYGPDSVGFYVSGQCLTEEYYVINKLIKGFIGSNNIDTNSRLCMSSAVVGYKLTLGEDSVPVCYDDIELADCFFVTGANPAWCHPIIWRRVEAHKQANPNVKIIVVDPRRTQTASQADLHLQIHPGTDITLTNAIGRVLIEKKWIDQDFITNNTEGFEAYQTQVMQKSLVEAAEICGITPEEITLAAQYIHESKGFLSMWTMGLNQSVIGVNKNLSLIDLHLITGKIGREGNGPFSLTGQPNAMGGREVGGLANMLPAHRDLLNLAHRDEVQTFWGGTKISDKPGFSATEMFEALADGRMKAIWVVCTNPLVSMPDVTLVEKALEKAKFVVVQDISNRSDTIKYADVVLPAAAWLEKEGTMTNSERRITHLPKVLDAPGEAKSDTEIINLFANKMGFGEAFDYTSLSEVYDEHCRSTKGTNIDISGLNYEVLKENRSIQWPYPANAESVEKSFKESGTRRLFTDGKFYTLNQKAKIHAVPDENHSESLNEDFPLVMTTGRIRDQWHTMTKTGKVNKLNQHIAQPYLEIHPEDAQERQISDNQIVEIVGRRGKAQVKAKVTTDVKKGVCFMPMHFGRILGSDFGRTNNLTNSLYDPRSKEPDFKFTAVEVRAYVKPQEKIIIIGAGSAGLGFIKSYRELNQTDEIHVFSKEIYPFYNRVMLPDYISGAQDWSQLVKLREDQFIESNIIVHKGIEVVNIDRKNKTIVDSEGNEHTYDRLILGMGSRAFMPPSIPKIPGIFNMRSRIDADSLMPFLKQDNPHALIVGGGLLGLELAASLREINVKVTIVQRISRFMDRQLDPLGSELLTEEILNLGIDVYFNDEVSAFYGTDNFEGVRLKSGRKIDAQVAVFAIGTSPNVEIARAAGIEVNRGVVVNDYLQTSDESIFAAGEIAQWRGQMWGITAAAEQQADIIAKYIAGDFASYYKGSLSMNIMKIQGVQLCSLGMIDTPKSPDYEEIIFIDKAKRYYKKCIIHNDKLVGAILIGDKSEFLEFKDLIANGIELSDKRLELLRSGKKADPVMGKLVCSCNNVGEGNLKSTIASGCKDFTALCSQTGAGMGCGSCRPEVRAILENALKEALVEA